MFGINDLINDCVHACCVTMFKNRLDKYLVRADYI